MNYQIKGKNMNPQFKYAMLHKYEELNETQFNYFYNGELQIKIYGYEDNNKGTNIVINLFPSDNDNI